MQLYCASLSRVETDAKAVRQWLDELERLGRILGQIGPDEVCCEGGLYGREQALPPAVLSLPRTRRS